MVCAPSAFGRLPEVKVVVTLPAEARPAVAAEQGLPQRQPLGWIVLPHNPARSDTTR